MTKPRIYADFNNADSLGRLRLNCVGAVEDLARRHVQLREGMLLTLYTDDLDDEEQPDELLAEGVVSFSEGEQCWVAAIDWSAIRHASDVESPRENGNSHPTSVPPAKLAEP
jgi:hypothetical protein